MATTTGENHAPASPDEGADAETDAIHDPNQTGVDQSIDEIARQVDGAREQAVQVEEHRND